MVESNAGMHSLPVSSFSCYSLDNTRRGVGGGSRREEKRTSMLTSNY